MCMVKLDVPTAQQQQQAAATSLSRGFNYDAVGWTEAGAAASKSPVQLQLPDRPWMIDHKRVKVGEGQATFDKARSILQRWGHFQLGWVGVVDAETPVKEESPVCVVAKTLFLWTANPLRIVYVKDSVIPRPLASSNSSSKAGKHRKPGKLHTYTFAHGCLKGHLLAGEERFALEYDTTDNSVWYDIYTFSRPAHPLSLLTYPLVRYYQKTFAHESAVAVAAACATTPL